jgi:Ca2+-transporting ATPase
MSAHTALVLRDGALAHLPAAQLVPGDIVILEAGKIVPADMRLIEAAQLKIEEASLTGESLPVEKQVDPLGDAHLPLGDRSNMAYKGTIVTYGRGRGDCRDGMATELERSPLCCRMKMRSKPSAEEACRLWQRLALAILAICITSSSVCCGRAPLMLHRHLPGGAAIPGPPGGSDHLPAPGAGSWSAECLIRKLPAVETLGSVT